MFSLRTVIYGNVIFRYWNGHLGKTFQCIASSLVLHHVSTLCFKTSYQNHHFKIWKSPCSVSLFSSYNHGVVSKSSFEFLNTAISSLRWRGNLDHAEALLRVLIKLIGTWICCITRRDQWRDQETNFFGIKSAIDSSTPLSKRLLLLYLNFKSMPRAKFWRCQYCRGRGRKRCQHSTKRTDRRKAFDWRRFVRDCSSPRPDQRRLVVCLPHSWSELCEVVEACSSPQSAFAALRVRSPTERERSIFSFQTIVDFALLLLVHALELDHHAALLILRPNLPKQAKTEGFFQQREVRKTDTAREVCVGIAVQIDVLITFIKLVCPEHFDTRHRHRTGQGKHKGQAYNLIPRQCQHQSALFMAVFSKRSLNSRSFRLSKNIDKFGCP